MANNLIISEFTIENISNIINVEILSGREILVIMESSGIMICSFIIQISLLNHQN